VSAVPQLLALHEANPAGLQPTYYFVPLLFPTPLNLRPRSSLRSLLVNMPSYRTFAVLALAASTVSPALSAPVQYGCLYLLMGIQAFLTCSICLGKSGGRL
jgi:hypothetical protein